MKITLAVLAEKLDNLIETNKNEHADILRRQDKTNGGIKTNADRINKLESLKNIAIGALLVMNTLLLPIAFMLIRQWINNLTN